MEEKSKRDLTRRMLDGRVVSNKMTKTVKVVHESLAVHKRYKKVIKQRTFIKAHHELESIPVGSVVRVMESRPLSRTKHWVVVKVLK